MSAKLPTLEACQRSRPAVQAGLPNGSWGELISTSSYEARGTRPGRLQYKDVYCVPKAKPMDAVFSSSSDHLGTQGRQLSRSKSQQSVLPGDCSAACLHRLIAGWSAFDFAVVLVARTRTLICVLFAWGYEKSRLVAIIGVKKGSI